MITILKQAGSVALVSLIALGLTATPALAQNAPNENPFFKVGQPPPPKEATGGGQAFAYTPKTGTGSGITVPNNGQAAPPPQATSPYNTLLNNPYAATMTSNPYGSGPAPAPYPYYGYYGLADPYGGYLRGAADVISSQGQYLINAQQAYLLREQVRMAQLEYSKANFDYWRYRRENTPTLEDERERAMREELRRSRNDPPQTEIWSAKALNDLLLSAQNLQSKNVQGPDIRIDAEILKNINVTSGKGGANVGVLRNDGKLSWPIGLRELTKDANEAREFREQLQALSSRAFDDAVKKNQIQTDTIKQMSAVTNGLRNILQKNVGDMSFMQYSDAKRYLTQLDDAIKALSQEDGANYLNGRYTVQGQNVAAVIRHMSEKGLRFAPATGNEAYYNAMYRALRDYESAANILTAGN